MRAQSDERRSGFVGLFALAFADFHARFMREQATYMMSQQLLAATIEKATRLAGELTSLPALRAHYIGAPEPRASTASSPADGGGAAAASSVADSARPFRVRSVAYSTEDDDGRVAALLDVRAPRRRHPRPLAAAMPCCAAPIRRVCLPTRECVSIRAPCRTRCVARRCASCGWQAGRCGGCLRSPLPSWRAARRARRRHAPHVPHAGQPARRADRCRKEVKGNAESTRRHPPQRRRSRRRRLSAFLWGRRPSLPPPRRSSRGRSRRSSCSASRPRTSGRNCTSSVGSSRHPL